MFDPPVFIVVRDRVKPLSRLVDWLEQAGHKRLVLVDNASTYPPLLEYLDQTFHGVLRMQENWGARVVWGTDYSPDEPYVVTDPDCVPIEDCPSDAIAHLRSLLEKHPSFNKAGLGLYLDDVPAHCPYLGHERLLVSKEIEPGVFESAIDTTFALYRPGVPFETRAIRTGFPYQVRHLSPSFYCDAPLTVEERYYLDHARKDSEGSTWARKWA